jgi:hypothetical protein
MAYDLGKAIAKLYGRVSVPRDSDPVKVSNVIRAALVAAYDAGILEERERGIREHDLMRSYAEYDPKALIHSLGADPSHMTLVISLRLPIKTKNELNERKNVFKSRRKRASVARNTVRMALNAHSIRVPVAPVIVRLRRFAPSAGLDFYDGLPASQKSVADGVCDFLGIDDGDTDKVKFEYEQERAKEYAVKIEIWEVRNRSDEQPLRAHVRNAPGDPPPRRAHGRHRS